MIWRMLFTLSGRLIRVGAWLHRVTMPRVYPPRVGEGHRIVRAILEDNGFE